MSRWKKTDIRAEYMFDVYLIYECKCEWNIDANLPHRRYQEPKGMCLHTFSAFQRNTLNFVFPFIYSSVLFLIACARCFEAQKKAAIMCKFHPQTFYGFDHEQNCGRRHQSSKESVFSREADEERQKDEEAEKNWKWTHIICSNALRMECWWVSHVLVFLVEIPHSILFETGKKGV